MNRQALRVIVTLVPVVLSALGCDSSGDSSRSRLPSAPTPTPPTAAPPVAALQVFNDPTTGFSTSDLRDAQEQILQMNYAGELIWQADGTRLSGYRRQSYSGRQFIEGQICSEGCAFEIRFGSKDGEPRAYLTVDYGHDNPGTLVDVEVAGGALVVSRTNVFPPGSFTLSGVVTEMGPAGLVAIGGAWVARDVGGDGRGTTTDRNGFYAIGGLFNASGEVQSGKSGYVTDKRTVVVSGDTRLDITLVPTP